MTSESDESDSDVLDPPVNLQRTASMNSSLPKGSPVRRISRHVNSLDFRSKNQLLLEDIIKSRGYENCMVGVTILFIVNMIACNVYEDLHIPGSVQMMIPDELQPVSNYCFIFDAVYLILLLIFIVDNLMYAYTFGLNKRARVYHLAFEFTLIFILLGFTIAEIFVRKLRFKGFYFRLLDIVLIWRKVTVYQMLFVQFQMRMQFTKLKTEQMNPNERIMSILKFIEQNHKGIFKCVINEIRYCVKMISTG